MIQKLKETAIPPKESFYSKLNECKISDQNYAHAQNVCITLKIKNLGEYSGLYLKIDILLQTDIFESFHFICSDAYGVDSVQYLKTPSLA